MLDNKICEHITVNMWATGSYIFTWGGGGGGGYVHKQVILKVKQTRVFHLRTE